MWPGMQMKTPLIIFLMGVVLIFALSVPCQATIFENLPTMGPKSSALCNAVTADPPFGLSGHYNPAGLHKTPEGKITLKLAAQGALLKIAARFEPDNEYDGLLGTFKPKDDPLAYTSSRLDGMSVAAPFYTRHGQATLKLPAIVAPLGSNSVSYRAPGSRYAWGLNYMYPIMIGGFYRKPGNPGRYLGTNTSLIHLVYLQPAVSYKVTDTLFVGGAVGFGSSMFIQNLDVRATSDLTALTKLLGDKNRRARPSSYAMTFPPTLTSACSGSPRPGLPLASVTIVR
jgi:long-subunit fatty acid transport protein